MTRNRIVLAIGIVGFILFMSLSPHTQGPQYTAPDEHIVDDDSLPLPPIGPRDIGFSPFEEAFLFQLGDTDKMTGIQRENLLAAQYSQVLRHLHGSLPEVKVAEISGMTVVTIDGKPFATVLPADAPDYYGRLPAEQQRRLEQQIAAHWKRLLEQDLLFEAYRRSPQHLASFPYLAGWLLSLGLVCHALSDAFARRYLNSPGWSLKAFFWLGILSFIAALHPQLKPLAVTLAKGGLMPVFFFLILFTCCSLVYRIGCRMLETYVESYIERHRGTDLRLRQRLDTMSAGGRFLLATLVAIFGVITFLGVLGVDVGSLFAGAGIAGIALGVVGKDILIDYFYGVNILLDDQFSIGDFIETPVSTGTVERFNLRATRIRETDGGLSIVTNGQLTVIKNHSREFANADFKVGVAYGSDTNRCLELIREELVRLADERPGMVQSEPVFIGVQELAESAVVLRALVKTAALEQWAVGRELNARVLHRFQEEGVGIPFPQCEVWLRHEQTASDDAKA